ncbi:hypothetical protein Xoosp13_24 [Xanthomonas phage Xoo-sp13]|nr:hypothetical protein Xoosp13_24 [Xanthomonas phage Xoo-sp13]
MYDVTINNKSTDTTSFAAAKEVVKTAAYNLAESLAKPVRNGLYRSPKATARINADRVRSSLKVGAGLKLPKTASDVSGKVGPLNFAITRK